VQTSTVEAAALPGQHPSQWRFNASSSASGYVGVLRVYSRLLQAVAVSSRGYDDLVSTPTATVMCDQNVSRCTVVIILLQVLRWSMGTSVHSSNHSRRRNHYQISPHRKSHSKSIRQGSTGAPPRVATSKGHLGVNR
jgi:hypothetical protein